MKKLGVFITTHFERGFRHGPTMENNMVDFFINTVINGYEKYDSGLGNDCDVYICDTGSNEGQFTNWINNKEYCKINKNINKIDIPNVGGCFSSLKYLMHNNPSLAQQYEHILVHTDDNPRPVAYNWGKDLIRVYVSHNNLGIMGRYLDKIRMGPTGLVDHRNCCEHVAKIWNIQEITVIPHLHADWWMMNIDTLLKLADVWWDNVHSAKSMYYQKWYEAMNFCDLANLPDNRKTIDNIHIGREADTPLRLSLINKDMATYDGIAFWPNSINNLSGFKPFEE